MKKEQTSSTEWIERAIAERNVRNAVDELIKILSVSGLKSLVEFLNRFKPKKTELKDSKKK